MTKIIQPIIYLPALRGDGYSDRSMTKLPAHPLKWGDRYRRPLADGCSSRMQVAEVPMPFGEFEAERVLIERPGSQHVTILRNRGGDALAIWDGPVDDEVIQAAADAAGAIYGRPDAGYCHSGTAACLAPVCPSSRWTRC